MVDRERTRIRRMFAAISPRYDLANHVLSLNIDRLWRRRAVAALHLSAGARILDVCTGTADLALELTRAARGVPEARVYGADFTVEMVRIGAQKRRQRGLEQPFLCVADALSLPFGAATFDAVTVAFGIRNVERLDQGLAEIWRVLKPGGQAAILDFATPRTKLIRRLYQAYFHSLLPRLGAWISRSPAAADAYRYLPASVAGFPPPEELSELLRAARFEEVGFRRLTCGIAALHLARRPQRDASGRTGRSGEDATAPPAPADAKARRV